MLVRFFRRPHRGMTLIELLVVISILTTLSGLLLGGVQKVRSVVASVERQNWREQHKLGETQRRTQPIKMLFIGNSFTYYNDLPGLIQAAAVAGKKTPIIVETRAYASHSLESNWNRPETLARIQDPNADWDFVVLQEMRGLPVARTGPDGYGFLYGRNEYFVPSVKKFDREIRDRRAITMLYMTWKVPALAGTVQEDWSDSHIRLAREIRAECSPVGMAIERAIRRRPELALFADSYPGHLNATGGYLAACAFYATIFNESPVGLPPSLPYASGGVNAVGQANATFLQTCAWDAYLECKKRLNAP